MKEAETKFYEFSHQIRHHWLRRKVSENPGKERAVSLKTLLDFTSLLHACKYKYVRGHGCCVGQTTTPCAIPEVSSIFFSLGNFPVKLKWLHIKIHKSICLCVPSGRSKNRCHQLDMPDFVESLCE